MLRPSLEELDTISSQQAAELLRSCCGASRWVSAMVAHRPFGTREAMRAVAVTLWRALSPADWQEAFRHHPRIGDQRPAAASTDRSQQWSDREQAGVQHADSIQRSQLAGANQAYERRFGWIYIVHATGKSTEEMLAIAQRRLKNSVEAELQVSAYEQEKIMLNRLDKLLAEDRPGGHTP